MTQCHTKNVLRPFLVVRDGYRWARPAGMIAMEWNDSKGMHLCALYTYGAAEPEPQPVRIWYSFSPLTLVKGDCCSSSRDDFRMISHSSQTAVTALLLSVSESAAAAVSDSDSRLCNSSSSGSLSLFCDDGRPLECPSKFSSLEFHHLKKFFAP